jgi:hypothetical protein
MLLFFALVIWCLIIFWICKKLSEHSMVERMNLMNSVRNMKVKKPKPC